MSTLRDEITEIVKEEVGKIEVPQNGTDGETPTKEELIALIKPLIPKVKDGITPTKTELVKLIEPLIPKVRDGIDADPVDKEKIIKDVLSKVIIPEPLKPPTLEEIITEIEEQGLEIKNIKDFDKRVRKIFVGGGIPTPVTTINNPTYSYRKETSNYNITADDYLVDVSGTLTVTLPSAKDLIGKVYNIKKTSLDGTITVVGMNNQTIDGEDEQVIVTQYTSLVVLSDGKNFLII